jgi:hypothetical protein
MTDLVLAVLTDHARRQMVRRDLDEGVVRYVLEAPDSVELVREGRIVAQKFLPLGKPARQYLIRVFVDVDRTPAEIVTVYRTSRIGKYGRP